MEKRSAQSSQASSGGTQPDGATARKQRTRREMLTLLSAGLGGLGAVIIGVPIVGALLAPLLRPQPGEWRDVGAPDSFKVGETTIVNFLDSSPLSWAGPAANTAAWLRRIDAQTFEAFAINCTHLGCPVRWIQTASLFMCPCHGGVFSQDGKVAAGPPLKPLSTYPVRVQNGQVQIQTSAVPIA